jgi:hypothetical protein
MDWIFFNVQFCPIPGSDNTLENIPIGTPFQPDLAWFYVTFCGHQSLLFGTLLSNIWQSCKMNMIGDWSEY